LVVFLFVLAELAVVVVAILGQLAVRPALDDVESVAAEGIGGVIAPGNVMDPIDRAGFSIALARPANRHLDGFGCRCAAVLVYNDFHGKLPAGGKLEPLEEIITANAHLAACVFTLQGQRFGPGPGLDGWRDLEAQTL